MLLGGEFLDTSLIKDGWSFTPILDGGNINKIFAVRTEDALNQYVVTGMMIEIDSDGDFVSLAWSNASYEEMLVSVASEWTIDYENMTDRFSLNIDYSDLLEEIDKAEVGSPLHPAPFTFGLYENDPLQVLVQAVDDPEPILTPLEGAGHAAVGSVGGSKVGPPTPADDDCLRLVSDLVHGVVAAAEDYVHNGADFMDRFQFELSESSSGSCPCEEAITVETGDWVTTCGDWVMGELDPMLHCRARREWSRTRFTIQTRTYTLVCSDCTEQECEQSRTRTMSMSAYGPPFNIDQWGCVTDLVPGSEGEQPEGAPCNPVTWIDLAFNGADATTWQPANCPGRLHCPD